MDLPKSNIDIVTRVIINEPGSVSAFVQLSRAREVDVSSLSKLSRMKQGGE